jgi:hypothetical protein
LLCGLPNSPEKTVVTEQFNTCLKKGRGLGKASLALIEATALTRYDAARRAVEAAR